MRDAIGLALLFAYVNRRPEAVDFLLQKDGNWNMTGVNNGTALHRAAWDGDLAMVKRLVAKGADMSNRDNPFHSTPLSWAQHNKQQEVVDWTVANCAIDLHEAVGMNLREHVEARLREDPGSVNKHIDMWEAPQSTALYWAAWTQIQDVDGTHYWPECPRISGAAPARPRRRPEHRRGRRLHGAGRREDARAPRVAALTQERGGKSAAELRWAAASPEILGCLKTPKAAR